MIEGLKIIPLKQIFDDRGKVMHMLRNDNEHFMSFGEIYFSCTYPGVVKAWHMHKQMTLNYAVISGQIQFVVYDDRSGSSTQGVTQEIYISPENYHLVVVPPLVWNGFKCIGSKDAIVANCSDIPHSEHEIIRVSPEDANIPYSWDREVR